MNTERSKRRARSRPAVVLPAPAMPVISHTSVMRSILRDGRKHEAARSARSLPGPLREVERQRLQLDREVDVLEPHFLADPDAARGEVEHGLDAGGGQLLNDALSGLG